MRVIAAVVWILGLLVELVLVMLGFSIIMADTAFDGAGSIASVLAIIVAVGGGIVLGLTANRAFPERWPNGLGTKSLVAVGGVIASLVLFFPAFCMGQVNGAQTTSCESIALGVLGIHLPQRFDYLLLGLLTVGFIWLGIRWDREQNRHTRG
jgi:hypothetical protein